MHMIPLSLLYIVKTLMSSYDVPLLQSDPKMLININGQSKKKTPHQTICVSHFFFSPPFFFFLVSVFSASVLFFFGPGIWRIRD